MNINELLVTAAENEVSDVHITVGSAPAFRRHGLVIPIDDSCWANLNLSPEYFEQLTPEKTKELAGQLMTKEQWDKFHQVGELDFSYHIKPGYRFRVNAYKQQGETALAVRVLSTKILTFSELGLPPALETLCEHKDGLVLVTGPTGSGKSTTLASMLDYINTRKSCHIITLEDPIEYLHVHKKSIVNQREVGKDTASFARGLRAALREDPDVILVGEMRDLETISTAVTAAETGHLVLASLHTSSAVHTIDRVIDVFPPHQQQQIRVQLAGTLRGVIAQQLVPAAGGKGRVPAVEIMVATPAVRNLIREGKTHQIASHIQTGARYNMQTLDSSLQLLYKKGLISEKEVLSRAADPETMKKFF